MSDGQEVVRSVILRNRYGLHVRPATTIAQTAKDFACEIALIKDENEVDAKSIFSMLTLGAEQGTELTLRARGADSEAAVDKLADVISNFDVND
ncbi:MAG: HPr family phosphocarrier protein [Planctomycetota bacterium]